LLATSAEAGLRRIALYGVGDLAEVAVLCAMRHQLDVVGIADDRAKIDSFLNLVVVRDLKDLPAIDGALLTDSVRPQQSFEMLSKQIDPAHILVPDLLHVTRDSSGLGRAGS
jgi:hypothetical protein